MDHNASLYVHSIKQWVNIQSSKTVIYTFERNHKNQPCLISKSERDIAGESHYKSSLPWNETGAIPDSPTDVESKDVMFWNTKHLNNILSMLQVGIFYIEPAILRVVLQLVAGVVDLLTTQESSRAHRWGN